MEFDWHLTAERTPAEYHEVLVSDGTTCAVAAVFKDGWEWGEEWSDLESWPYWRELPKLPSEQEVNNE